MLSVAKVDLTFRDGAAFRRKALQYYPNQSGGQGRQDYGQGWGNERRPRF